MAVKGYKPTTPTLRAKYSQDFSQITSKRPAKSLLRRKKSISGRNNQGRITTRHRGGSVKKFYRIVNFDLRDGFAGKVEQIEYDPNRSAYIARVRDERNNLHYVLATKSMKIGHKIESGENASISEGNRLPVKKIPSGTLIHNVELIPENGAKVAKGAGTYSQLVAKEEDSAQVRLPSGEIRRISLECKASIGAISNEGHQNIKLGKAGSSRKRGIRPTVRGVVMNAIDHPHGGGDGGRHGTAKDPRSPWGQKTLGYKTRRRKKTDKFIVRSRHQSKRK